MGKTIGLIGAYNEEKISIRATVRKIPTAGIFSTIKAITIRRINNDINFYL